MLKTLIGSDFTIDCQHGNHLKYPTVVASVIGCVVILLAVPLTRHFYLTIPNLRTMWAITNVYH